MIAVGENIKQTKMLYSEPSEVTEEDINIVRGLFTELRSKIEKDAPEDKRSAALERISEMESELTEGHPQLSTFDYVKNWFGKNLPSFVGGVVSVIVHPIVGKIVEAAGEIAAEEIKKRFRTS